MNFSQKPSMKWQKLRFCDNKLNLQTKTEFNKDIIFTKAGRVVTNNQQDNSLLMYDQKGNIIAHDPYFMTLWRLTYDHIESAILVLNKFSSVIFESERDLNTIWGKGFPLDIDLEPFHRRAGGIGVLSDGRFVVAPWNNGKNGKGTIGIYERNQKTGKMLKEISHYGKGDYEIMKPEYIAVLPDDTIVVSMWKNNHVVYFDSELNCLQVVDVKMPGGLAVRKPQNDILVAARSPDRVCLLSGTVGSVKYNTVMEFTKQEREEWGYITSLAMRGRQLAVVFDRALNVYEWPSNSVET